MVLNTCEIQVNTQNLRSILEKALGSPGLELADWKIEPLSGGLEQGHQLFRLTGEALLSGAKQIRHPWSLVLKIVHPAPTTEQDPQGVHYWKREALAYQSGLLDGLSCSLTAPRCYEASLEGEAYWLWLEEVKDYLGKPWSLQQHYEVARCLGCSNGAYLAGKRLPEEPWLSHHWLRKYVEETAPNVQILPELCKLPLFQRSFPLLDNDFLLEAWNMRGIFLDALERLPQTFCHQDAFAGNLFWQGKPGEKGSLVAVDWAYTGSAAAGVELAPLIVMSSFELDAHQLFETCLKGYLAGLAESDWHGDPRQVRFAALAACFYRYVFGAVIGEMWTLLKDENTHPAVAVAFGVPDVGVLCDSYALQNLTFQGYYAEARQILTQLA